MMKAIKEFPIVTHDGIMFNGPGYLVPHDFDFYAHAQQCKAAAIAIDEFQFLSEDNDTLLKKMTRLANLGKKLFLAGLDKDFKGVPFEKLAFAACEADLVEKTTAICFHCNADATHTCKYAGTENRLEEGGEEKYKPLCRSCFHNFVNSSTNEVVVDVKSGC